MATFVSANRPLGSPQVLVTQPTGPYDTYDMHNKNEVRLDQSDGFSLPVSRCVRPPCGVGSCLSRLLQPISDWQVMSIWRFPSCTVHVWHAQQKYNMAVKVFTRFSESPSGQNSALSLSFGLLHAAPPPTRS